MVELEHEVLPHRESPEWFKRMCFVHEADWPSEVLVVGRLSKARKTEWIWEAGISHGDDAYTL